MQYNHDRIKMNAKLHYQRNTGYSILASLIMIVLSTMVSYFISFLLAPVTQVGLTLISLVGREIGSAAFAIVGVIFGIIIYLTVTIGVSAFTGLFIMGGENWYRRTIREENLSVDKVFEAFSENFLSNAVTIFLKQLYINLWSLLFVVPGIIKYYSYYMTDYIKMEFPDVRPSRAIEISKIMTDGYKGQLFYLDLSFIGWFLLSVLTMNILGIVYVFPYYYAAKAFAYEELKALASDKIYEFPQEAVRY